MVMDDYLEVKKIQRTESEGPRLVQKKIQIQKVKNKIVVHKWVDLRLCQS